MEQHNMRKALIFCNHQVPFAEPNAIRLINIALMLNEMRFETTLYGVGCENEKCGIVKGIQFVEWAQTLGQGIKPHEARKKEFIGNVRKTVETSNDVQLIISALSANAIKAHNFLREYAEKNRIAFVQSIVEWYGLANLGGWKYIYRFVKNEYVMRFVNPKSKNIISISSYMGDYYKNKKCNVIVIPTIVDMNEYKDLSHTNNSKIIIVYAGSPRRKDCIVNAILALDKLTEEEKNKIEFNIYGATREQLKQNGLLDKVIKRLGQSFVDHGRIPYSEVKEHVANADFTILLRHNTLNANAGFSTKIGESMACGTPVIANITSDLDKYVIDCRTGVICIDESVNACVSAYRKILAWSEENRTTTRIECLKMAMDVFDYRNYSSELSSLIGDAK